MDDIAIIQRILDHISSKKTDLGTRLWREPVDNYRSKERFDLEIELLKRLPMVFCPSAAIPEPGSYLARTVAGTPLLSVRGNDGAVRTFHNSCRHRGMILAEGCGKTHGFICSYHAWAYGLDGTLKNIAGRDGFPGLNKEEHGLIAVDTTEKNGLVFVTQKKPISRGALKKLPNILSADQKIFETTNFNDWANWKLLSETSMEGYHIKALHNKSFYPFGFDNLNIFEQIEMNSRIVFPFRRIEKLRNIPKNEWRAEGMLTYVYQLYPNARLSKLSNHDQLVILEPVSFKETNWTVYRLSPPGTQKSPEKLQNSMRDAAFVKDTGVAEDRVAASSIQKALLGEGNTHFTFGRYEAAAVHFHENWQRHLDELIQTL
jgi:phenylpropionate dioxygenase-like ring-hydroxylating dioxygenase large terminal subunit